MFTFLMISLLSCSSNILSILSFRMDSVLRRCYTRIAHIFFDIQPSFSTRLFVYCSTVSLLTGVMGPPIDVLCCRSLFSSQQRLSLPFRHFKIYFTDTVTEVFFSLKTNNNLANFFYTFVIRTRFSTILAPSVEGKGSWGGGNDRGIKTSHFPHLLIPVPAPFLSAPASSALLRL